jgi:hypothetical protein
VYNFNNLVAKAFLPVRGLVLFADYSAQAKMPVPLEPDFMNGCGGGDVAILYFQNPFRVVCPFFRTFVVLQKNERLLEQLIFLH